MKRRKNNKRSVKNYSQSILTILKSDRKQAFNHKQIAAKLKVNDASSRNQIIKNLHKLAGQKEIEVRLKESSGKIESSLWNALVNNNMSPALVMELSGIYAWTIDFFRIQKGDYFKIIYEERYVEDEFIGIGRVYAALFNHANEDFYAFYFEEQENYGDYFDDEGGALRKAFLRAPLNYSRISSSYSKRIKSKISYSTNMQRRSNQTSECAACTRSI